MVGRWADHDPAHDESVVVVRSSLRRRLRRRLDDPGAQGFCWSSRRRSSSTDASMKKILCALMVLAVAGNGYAIEPSPVLLVVRSDMGAKSQATDAAGLRCWIGAGPTMAREQAKRAQSSEFHACARNPLFPEWSQTAFSCFASSQPCAARPAFHDIIIFGGRASRLVAGRVCR